MTSILYTRLINTAGVAPESLSTFATVCTRRLWQTGQEQRNSRAEGRKRFFHSDTLPFDYLFTSRQIVGKFFAYASLYRRQSEEFPLGKNSRRYGRHKYRPPTKGYKHRCRRHWLFNIDPFDVLRDGNALAGPSGGKASRCVCRHVLRRIVNGNMKLHLFVL